MASRTVIADASALISLNRVGQIALLPALFGSIVVPPAVAAEVTRGGGPLPNWIAVFPLAGAVDARVEAARLGAGESEVLSIGLEMPAALLILDDGAARELASALRLRITGTAAVLVEAKRAGLIAEVRPVLDALVATRFRLSSSVYEQILEAAGEK